MTSISDSGGWHEVPGPDGGAAGEHLTMHLYTFESTAADPTSHAFTPEADELRDAPPASGPRQDDRQPGKVRIRTYP